MLKCNRGVWLVGVGVDIPKLENLVIWGERKGGGGGGRKQKQKGEKQTNKQKQRKKKKKKENLVGSCIIHIFV